MRNQLPRTLFAALFLFAAGALPADAAAQRRRPHPRARGYTKAQVDAVIKRVESRSDLFVKLFDRSLDRGSLDGTRREDDLNERARHLERALDDLRREFDRKEGYAETRPEVSRCLHAAEDINRVMRRRRMGAETERQWALLRAELNTLADVYALPLLR